MPDFGLLPVQASDNAASIDDIFIGLILLSGVIILIVSGGILIYAIRYRKGSTASRAAMPEIFSREIEIGWTLTTLLTFLLIFAWAAAQNVRSSVPPAHYLEIHVVAKQWMWKFEHPGGQREINTLHLPVNQPVMLIMNSQDVIHSFYAPAFRLKRDVVPGMEARLSFTVIAPGEYHLFCAEYCGAGHALMGGSIVALSQDEYARWISGQPRGETLASEGARLFASLGCANCHEQGIGPDLHNLFGSTVKLTGGGQVKADEAYVRESILQPQAKIVEGFQPVMPSFAGQVSEADLVKLIAYIRSLGPKSGEKQ
jgi:cytochrome c oxidase subunit 2